MERLLCTTSIIMLRSLPVPLENSLNTSSQLLNNVRYHFQVVFNSGELGNFKASPFVPHSLKTAIYLQMYVILG